METPVWALSIAYWLHMLATILWIGGLTALSIIVLPAAKKVLNQTRNMFLTNGLELETDFWSRLTATEDMKEGVRAFIEKRKPDFKGL